jgi:hypothetical protein
VGGLGVQLVVFVEQCFYSIAQLPLVLALPGSATGAIVNQLKGHWLIQAGFTIDSPVKVRIMQGCLVLTAE